MFVTIHWGYGHLNLAACKIDLAVAFTDSFPG